MLGRGGAVAKAFVDDQLEAIGHCRPRARGNQQRERSNGDVQGIVKREAPHHAQAAERAPFGPVWTGCHGKSLTAAPRSLKWRAGQWVFCRESKVLPRMGVRVVNDRLTN